MAILSDGSIRAEIEAGRIRIDPFDAHAIQPASIDVRLDRLFRVFNTHSTGVVEPFDEQDLTTLVKKAWNETFILHPGEFVLGSTFEDFVLPNTMVGRVEGKSSLGRLAVVVHSTAGFIDPGFVGHITLELSNASTLPITLTPGMKIAQIAFEWLDQPAERPYGHASLNSKYSGQRGPTASLYHRNPRPTKELWEGRKDDLDVA